MTRLSLVLATLLIVSHRPTAAQSNEPPPSPDGAGAPPAAATAEKRPLRALPYEPSLDPASMDRTVDPCTDLYTYSCGGWMRANPVPPDQSRWSVYNKVYDENQQFLWGILQEASSPDPARAPAQQKIGDYFASCMDEDAVEQAGTGPIKNELTQIAALTSSGDIARTLGRLHPTTFGSGLMFATDVEQDPKKSEEQILFAFAGGLGLPDRDYYVKDDEKSVATRERYLEHVKTMLELLGETPEAAKAGAGAVMRIETALAKASLTRVERRDPYKTYHNMSIKGLQALTPAFRWKDYLDASGTPPISRLNVTEPGFFRELEARLKSESLADWKTYLRWHLVNERASYLSSKFAKPTFDFYRGYLRGVKEMPPRWKRCVGWIDRDLGEAMGQVFVEKSFGPEVKKKALQMVTEIEAAMDARIRALDWMGPATKKRALEKLHAMRNKVGYPDRWRDYGTLEIRRGDFLGNVLRAAQFESRRQHGKIGKPVDHGEWGMTPPTVNAYYDASMNDMNFPAGVLLPPLFDLRLDDAPNYGNTGGTIGHELTHGFDDEGRQYDARGNLYDWWTKADAAEFEKRAACVSDQYAQYVVVDELKINSKLTLGEDLADLGGTILAWVAWKNAVRGPSLPARDGLTPEQRFFVGFAQWDCENERPESKRLNGLTNPHSPGKYRINGVVANMPEFREAFSCKAGAPLVHDHPCRIW